jgi:exopolysaccharide production protein ExoZ
MSQPKIANLQALRGIAVLLVLLRHISVMENKYDLHDSFMPEFWNAGTCGVDLFFVISGFIMVTISLGRHQMRGAFREFLYRRATRIYPLYWIFSLVVFGVWLAQPDWVNGGSTQQVDLIGSLLLLPRALPPLLGQGWTLVHELYFYLFFAFGLLLPQRRLPLFLGAWAMTVVLGWVLILPGATAPAIRILFHPLTAEFLLGAVSALFIRRTNLWAGLAFFMAGSGALSVLLASPGSETPSAMSIVVRGLVMAAVVHGAVAIERGGRILLPRFLGGIGEAAYSIYLSHILVISAVGRLWTPVAQPGLGDNVFIAIIMVAAALGFGFGCHHFLELPLLRLAHGRRLPDAPNPPLRSAVCPSQQD